MFKRLFGGGGDGAGGAKPQAPAVAPRTTTSTVDAIQKLAEVGGRRARHGRRPGCCRRRRSRRVAPAHRLRRACLLQSEDLLNKRRDLLEKKIAAELNKAKEYQKKNNKKGTHAAAAQRVSHGLLAGAATTEGRLLCLWLRLQHRVAMYSVPCTILLSRSTSSTAAEEDV